MASISADHGGLHLRLLGSDELGLLEAREHALPVPVQVALHVRGGGGGAVLALLNGIDVQPLGSFALVALCPFPAEQGEAGGEVASSSALPFEVDADA